MIDNILQHPKEAVFENYKQSAFVSSPQAGFLNLSTVDILMRWFFVVGCIIESLAASLICTR